MKTPEGATIPFFSAEDIRHKESRRRADEAQALLDSLAKTEGGNVTMDGVEEGTAGEGGESKVEGTAANGSQLEVDKSAANVDIRTLQSQIMNNVQSEGSMEMGTMAGQNISNQMPSGILRSSLIDQTYEPSEQDIFEEFLAQVSFKRTTEIGGYSSTKIQFSFVPMKLGTVARNFTLFLENQDYTKPIPISVRGRCVDVPIYVEKEEYNLNVLVYEQFYREKIILHNRGSSAMKIQLFFPKDFKPYLEFNPTLGFIQGNGDFEIWAKLKPDRSILQTCSRFLVKQNEEPPKDEYEEFTMRIPVKVTGAN